MKMASQNKRGRLFSSEADLHRQSSDSVFTVSPAAPLLEACRPSTIGSFVVAVWVYSFECEAAWAVSHVAKKAHETLPPLTNANPTSAVILVILGVRVLAALAHGPPDVKDALAAVPVLLVPVVTPSLLWSWCAVQGCAPFVARLSSAAW